MQNLLGSRSFCQGKERRPSPYNKYRYLVICKNPECLLPRYGSNSFADAGFANFFKGSYGLNFAAKVAQAITLGVIKIDVQEPCQCRIYGKNGTTYSCGFKDCQFIDTKKNPNYWK